VELYCDKLDRVKKEVSQEPCAGDPGSCESLAASLLPCGLLRLLGLRERLLDLLDVSLHRAWGALTTSWSRNCSCMLWK
jgi:hypothetical protein